MTETAAPGDTRTRTVRGDGVDLHVTERGDPAAATIVLIHGYPDTSAVWDPVAERLAADHHVVTYDVRGAGGSGVPADREGYRLDHLVADVRAVVDATSPDRPVHLVGHDWGSIQGWAAATDRSLDGRLASYTSISGPSLDHVGRWLQRRRRLSVRALRELAHQGRRSWYVYAFHLPRLPEAFWRGQLPARMSQVLEQTEGAETDDRWPAPTLGEDGAHGVELYRANVRDRTLRPHADRATVPVQLVVPTQDRFVTPVLLDGIEELAPDLWRRSVPAGHWVVRGRPDAAARWIAEFAAMVDGGPVPEALARERAATPQRPWTGRVAVITGGGAGIGREIALAAAGRGAEVVIADIDAAGAEATAERCRRAGVAATTHEVDVSDRKALAAFAERVRAEHGVPWLVVNNAGIAQVGSVLDATDAEWKRIVGVNLWGVIRGSRLFGRQMVEHGEGGHIVNLASAASFTPSVTFPAYGTTKAAVLQFTESLRLELEPAGINVSAICPGFVHTDIALSTRFIGTDEAEQDRRRRATDELYRRRDLSPDKVADAVLRAVDDRKPVVLVGVEAHLIRALSRLSPRLLRAAAKLDLAAR